MWKLFRYLSLTRSDFLFTERRVLVDVELFYIIIVLVFVRVYIL